MSILLRDVAPGRISPAAGLAVSDAITPLVDAKVSLKWPNDVEITGRKVAGILSESINACGAQWFIVGIGINVDVDFTVDGGQRLEGERAPGKAEDLSEQATSISAHRAASRGPVDREALIATVASSLEGRLSEEELLAAWKEHLTTIGQTVKIGSPTGVVEGTAVDVDNEGRLVLQDARGRLRSFAAGDVTVVA
jgi:BirA family biotin operon repressor/biotin-[acetyl-CoA-carboxylase] ligase